MNDDVLKRRGLALEEAFFAKRDQELIAGMWERVVRDDLQAAMRESGGAVNEQTLDYLVKNGIGPKTLAALKLVPLVIVCWANGVVEPEERELVMQSAAKNGLQPGMPGYDLLQGWLEHRPDPELFESWKSYVQAMASKADPATRASLKQEILATSRAVAEAAGKIFGYFLGTSAEEKAVLHEIEQAFDHVA
jgi:tellurite resistance protein